MPVDHVSQAVWRGVRFPDSDLVSLICRHVPRQGVGVVVACGNGRHVRLLEELGFDASGIDADEQMVRDAHANGTRVTHARLEDYQPDRPIDLLVAWGIMMVAEVADAERQIARLGARYIVANWRTADNTFARAAAVRGELRFNPAGVARCAIRDSAHLHGLTYLVHQPDACHFPGYARLTLRTMSVACDGEVNAWHQTVHERR